MYKKSAVLVHKNGAYLLIKENRCYQGRCWNLPQGKVEETETPEEAALRETKEETGLHVHIERKLGVLTDTFPDTSELHIFLATHTAGELTLSPNEIHDARWLSVSEIERMKDQLVGNWIIDMLYAHAQA